MDSDRDRAVKDLVDAALKVDLDSRGDFIRDASEGDLSLRNQALALLETIYAAQQPAGAREPAVSSAASGGPLDTDSGLLDRLPETTEPSTHPARVPALQFPGTARFEVRRRLGSGAFGTVYECYDRDQQQSVAVKVLRQTDPAFLYRFKREFRALVDIRHPNLVQLYELFGEDRFWFFSMEFVRGFNFLRYIRSDRTDEPSAARCNVDRLRDALRQLSEGVLVLHARGILHRDIKPANVLVSSEGRVQLLDFGLVHELEWSGSQSALMAGTPAYMAPERLSMQPAGIGSDWYSVGVMVYEALTGALPFDVSRFRYDSAIAHLASLGVPADLKRLCIDLLHPDPAKRPTGSEIRHRLDSPAPRLVAVSSSSPELVVGREAELERLDALIELTRQGRTVVVNLSGQSGIGKSTLLRALRRRLARTGGEAVMLVGRCHENESVPFKALDDFVDRLSQYLKALPAAEADAVAPRDTPSLTRMFPVLAQVAAIVRGRHRSLEIVDAEELRRRAFGSLQELIARLAERKTLVIAIDDLQWGDLDSAAFLRALFSGTSPPPVLMIAAYRSEDAATSAFLKNWRGYLEAATSLVVDHVELGELTTADSQRLAVGLLQSYAGISEAEAAASIVRESGGSPFLIEHFVRSIRWDRADQVGFDIRQGVEERLNELPDQTRRLLETLAIAGQPLAESVAFTAADWEASDRPALLALISEHFVRVREAHAPRQIEIYHDRLRAAIVASTASAVRQQRHLQLATALEREGAADPEAISTHWREAGHPDRASTYALSAGDRALNALAFDRAAQWYRLALDTGAWPRAQSLELHRKLAAALALAGRGAQAADVYLKAADTAEPHDRAELQRIAAEELLRSGHVDEGLVVLEALARELGIWMASKRWQQLLSLVLHRLRAALPDFRAPKKSLSVRADRQLMMLDVYWSFFVGLVDFDGIRASDFHARHMALAARVGDPKRIALSLAAEASSRVAFSGRESVRTRDLIARARVLCADNQSPEAHGFIMVSEALCALLASDFRRASRLAHEADRFLAEQCSGVAWERASVIHFGIEAAFHLGAWATIIDDDQHFHGRLEDARARGDVHAIVASMFEGTLRLLIADQPMQADQFVREAMSVLPSTRFLTQNLWALALRMPIALYMGDGRRAWTLVDASWRELRKSQFLRVEHAAMAALSVRASAALAVAALDQGSPAHAREAAACGQKLARKHSRSSKAAALLIHAGVASIRGERQPAVDLLQRAEAEFRICEMAHCVAACQYRRGQMTGGDEGRALIAAAQAWATAQRVVKPAGVFDMLAPGRWTFDA